MFLTEFNNPQAGPGPQLRAQGASWFTDLQFIPEYGTVTIPSSAQIGDYILISSYPSGYIHSTSPIPSSRWLALYGTSTVGTQGYGGAPVIFAKICEAGDPGNSVRIGNSLVINGAHVFTNPRGTGTAIATTGLPKFYHDFQQQVRSQTFSASGTNVSSLAVGLTQNGQPFGNGWTKYTACMSSSNSGGTYGVGVTISYSGPGVFSSRNAPGGPGGWSWHVCIGTAYEINSTNTSNTGTFTTNQSGAMSALTVYLP